MQVDELLYNKSVRERIILKIVKKIIIQISFMVMSSQLTL